MAVTIKKSAKKAAPKKVAPKKPTAKKPAAKKAVAKKAVAKEPVAETPVAKAETKKEIKRVPPRIIRKPPPPSKQELPEGQEIDTAKAVAFAMSIAKEMKRAAAAQVREESPASEIKLSRRQRQQAVRLRALPPALTSSIAATEVNAHERSSCP